MTDIETPNPAAPVNAAPLNPAPVPAKKHTVNFAFLWLFVLLIVAALCAGAWQLLQQGKNQQQLVDSLRVQLEEQVKLFDDRQQALEDSVLHGLTECLVAQNTQLGKSVSIPGFF